MKKIAATLIAGLFATAAFAQTTTSPSTPTTPSATSAMPAAGQDKQDGGSDAKDSPVAHKATKHTTKKHSATKAKAKMPADSQGTTAGSVSNGAVEAGSAAPAGK